MEWEPIQNKSGITAEAAVLHGVVRALTHLQMQYGRDAAFFQSSLKFFPVQGHCI